MEYSVLQSYVRDIGLPVSVDRMIPLVEVEIQTAIDRGAAGKTVGTVNPGVVWVGKSIQVGVEAVLRVNERSGKNVGVRAFPADRAGRDFRWALGSPALRQSGLAVA